MSFLSSLFKSKKVKPKPTYAWPGQKKLLQQLSTMAFPKAQERISRAGQAYRGELVAPLTQYERQSLNILGNYLAAPPPTTGKLWQQAKKTLGTTLEGDAFDKAYWQAYNRALDEELRRAQTRLASRTAAAGTFYGGGRMEQERLLEEEAMRQRGLLAAQLAREQQALQLQAVPLAAQLIAQEATLPLTQVEAGLRYGVAPRQVEQARLEAAYQEWLRQLADLGIPLDVATGLATYRPTVAYTSYTLPPIIPLLSGIGQTAASLAALAATA